MDSSSENLGGDSSSESSVDELARPSLNGQKKKSDFSFTDREIEENRQRRMMFLGGTFSNVNQLSRPAADKTQDEKQCIYLDQIASPFNLTSEEILQNRRLRENYLKKTRDDLVQHIADKNGPESLVKVEDDSNQGSTCPTPYRIASPIKLTSQEVFQNRQLREDFLKKTRDTSLKPTVETNRSQSLVKMEDDEDSIDGLPCPSPDRSISPFQFSSEAILKNRRLREGFLKKARDESTDYDIPHDSQTLVVVEKYSIQGSLCPSLDRIVSPFTFTSEEVLQNRNFRKQFISKTRDNSTNTVHSSGSQDSVTIGKHGHDSGSPSKREETKELQRKKTMIVRHMSDAVSPSFTRLQSFESANNVRGIQCDCTCQTRAFHVFTQNSRSQLTKSTIWLMSDYTDSGCEDEMMTCHSPTTMKIETGCQCELPDARSEGQNENLMLIFCNELVKMWT